MSFITIIIGVLVLLWGVIYRLLMSRWLKVQNKDDKRSEMEGLVLEAIEEKDKLSLIVEVEINEEKRRIKVPVYESKDLQAVGRIVFLRVDLNDLKHSEIDWDKELQVNQKKSIGKAVTLPSSALILTGLILILKGFHLF